MLTISYINEKGGVGKSTASLTTAAGLAIRGAKVLLIDTDPQANTTDHLFTPQTDALYRVIAQDSEWSDYMVEVPPQTWAGQAYKDAGIGRLILLPSQINNRLLPLAVDDIDLLGERLDELRGYVDAVIIDTSPTPSMVHAMIYRASTHVIVPTQFEKWSLVGMMKTISRINKEADERASSGLPALNFMGILPNLYENTIAHNHGRDQALAEFDNKVWEPITKRTIWREIAWGETERTIFSYAPGDIAEQEAWTLIDRVMQHA